MVTEITLSNIHAIKNRKRNQTHLSLLSLLRCLFGGTVEPVQTDTPRDQGNVSDCKGCRNTQGFILVNRNTSGP
jgi:hypothetical protein